MKMWTSEMVDLWRYLGLALRLGVKYQVVKTHFAQRPEENPKTQSRLV
jgi:hypothetical protein